MARRFFTASDGTRISYLDSGAPGVPVVIVHGLAGSATEFVPTAEALAHRRVVLIDQRGHGRSTTRPHDVSRESFVSDLVGLIEQIAPRVSLVGQSMGGHTAMLTAAARPDLVDQLVLLEADASGTDPDEPSTIRHFFESWPPLFRTRHALVEFLGDTPLHRAWAADLAEVHGGFAPRFEPGVMGEIMKTLVPERWAEWEQIETQTMVIFADRGMFRPSQKEEFVRRARNAQRIDLPGASHDAHLDVFGRWIEALRGFLRD